MIRARVVVPPSFTAANLELLKTRLEAFAGEPLNVLVQRDASLIGGFKVYMKSWVYDASVRARLETVRQALTRPEDMVEVTNVDGE